MSTAPEVKKALAGLLKDPGNQLCADCRTQTHPRWASWSLGVFICIKCAGIHRSLGTHISKVKSVDLDTWQAEHLQTLMEFRNNSRANAYYEAKLDVARPGFEDMNKLTNFIRSKYEYKKWCGTPSADNGVPSPPEASKKLLDQDVSSSNSSSSSATTTTATNTSGTSKLSKSSSLLDLQVPKRNNVLPSRKVTQRSDLKKSILSLYSKPSPSVSNNSTSIGFTPPAAFTSQKNESSISIDDDDLFKNVWTT